MISGLALAWPGIDGSLVVWHQFVERTIWFSESNRLRTTKDFPADFTSEPLKKSQKELRH